MHPTCPCPISYNTLVIKLYISNNVPHDSTSDGISKANVITNKYIFKWTWEKHNLNWSKHINYCTDIQVDQLWNTGHHLVVNEVRNDHELVLLYNDNDKCFI